jgi:hypothetical protein
MEEKLLTCTFDNGVKSCTATVCNFYPTLVLLGFLDREQKPNADTVCWIRDYKTSKPILTYPQLIKKVQNNLSDLRISFFSREPINRFGILTKLAMDAKFPSLSYNSSAPHHLNVYTIWWCKGSPQLIESGINTNPGAVIDMFRHVNDAYRRYYVRVDSESESDDGNYTIEN